MDARGKFGEHTGYVRVARSRQSRASLASRVFSKVPKCIHNSIDAQQKHEPTRLLHSEKEKEKIFIAR